MALLWIPGSCPKFEITDARLRVLIEKMKPVFRNKDKRLQFMKVPDLRGTAYTWDPEPTELVKEAYEVARIETHHRCGYILLFKPSIAEVLSQIPPHLEDSVTMFETVNDDDSIACYSDGDGHRAVTILYTDKDPHALKPEVKFEEWPWKD